MSYPIYLGLFVFLALESFIVYDRTLCRINVNVYSQYIFIFGVFVIFFCLRGYVFTDWVNYKRHYDEIPTNSIIFIQYLRDNGLYEIGYIILQYICKCICEDYFFLQFACSFIDLLILYRIIDDFSLKNIPLFFIFFLAFKGIEIEFNLLRNSKAIFLFFMSLRYIYKEKSFFKYLLINILGITFHFSAVLFIPLFFILDKKINKIVCWFIFVLGIVIMLSHQKIFTAIVSFCISWVPEAKWSLKFLNYFKGQNTASFSFIYLERIAIFVLFMMFYDKLVKDKKTLVLLNIYILYFVICFFCWDVQIIVLRISLLFVPCIWILIPYIYSSILTRRENKTVFISLCLLYCVLKIYMDCVNSGIFYNYTLCFFERDFYEKALLYTKKLYGIK